MQLPGFTSYNRDLKALTRASQTGSIANSSGTPDEWQGRLLRLYYWLSAALIWLGSLIWLLESPSIQDDFERVGFITGVLLVGAVLGALFVALGRGIKRKNSWAWYVSSVGLFLGIPVLIAVFTGVSDRPAGGLLISITIVLHGVWIHYLWTRRHAFNVGRERKRAPGTTNQPVRQGVTSKQAPVATRDLTATGLCSPGDHDPVTQLERLAQLHDAGHLDDSEYILAKNRILNDR